MTPAEEVEYVVDLLGKASDQSRNASMWLSDVERFCRGVGEVESSDEAIPYQGAAMLLGLAYSARYAAVSAVEAADECLRALLSQLQIAEDIGRA